MKKKENKYIPINKYFYIKKIKHHAIHKSINKKSIQKIISYGFQNTSNLL